MEGGAVGHNFEMGLLKDYPSQIWFNLVQRFQRRIKMSSNFNCSYMAVRRFTYTFNPSFSVEFFVQPIYTDYAN
jgi:hypothetical protein